MANDDENYRVSDETKAKISTALRGRAKSPEHRRAIAEAKQGQRHPNWGKETGEAVRAKISRANTNAERPNRKLTWEVVDHIRLLHRLGMTIRDIHERYPFVARNTVQQVIAGRKWKPQNRPED